MRIVGKIQNKFLRAAVMVSGILFMVLGITGIVFPILPATPFLLLAAWCFMKTSDRLYHWLMTNKLFGKYLKNYMEKLGIPVKIKVFLLTLLWLMVAYSVIFIFNLIYINVALLIISLIITIHILMIKTYREDKNEIH